MLQKCLNHPRGHLSFVQNKIFEVARFERVENSLKRIMFPNYLIAFYTLCVISQINRKTGPIQVEELKLCRRVFHFRETILNVTSNGNPIGYG